MTAFSFRELECFLAVAEELSFTRAAERLHLAQPPLSRHIRKLEEKLGVELFQRSRRKVSITAGGKAFREEAQDILARIRRAGDAAKRAAAGETQHLHIGFVSAVLSQELVELFCQFRNAHPNTRLNLHDRLPSEQIQELTNGDLDIGFIGVAPEKLPRNVIATRWMMERLMAFLPPQHELSGKKSIRLADLADESFVAISSEAAPAFSSHLRKICKEEGFHAHIVQEARRAQAVAAMSVTGSGVAILPASLHRLTGNGIPLRISGNRKAEIEYVVAAKSSANESVEQFLDLVR
jgi:DNA-binding transcriptional LysR family regulator